MRIFLLALALAASGLIGFDASLLWNDVASPPQATTVTCPAVPGYQCVQYFGGTEVVWPSGTTILPAH